MAEITLDFETLFCSKTYSLSKMTYEDYIFDRRFGAYGIGVKIDDEPSTWHHFRTNDECIAFLRELFPEGNDHTMIAHNNLFDAPVAHWLSGIRAKDYACTQMMSRALWRYESASLAKLCERLWPDDKSMRKGKELAVADGIVTMEGITPDIARYVGGYCIQDTDLCRAAYLRMRDFFKPEEMSTMDDTIRMFAEQPLTLDDQLVRDYAVGIEKQREEIFIKAGVPRDVLASDIQFVNWMKVKHGIEIKKVPSPTAKNPDNEKYPLAKNALEFILMRNAHPDLEHIWAGRVAAASNQEHTRCKRFLAHQHPDTKRIGVPLVYCGAGTTRFTGTNSINMQNLGRNSKLRNALTAGEGYQLIITDLSNIEGRMNAYHCEALWKLKKYADGDDLYNELAKEIFGYPVDRKKPEFKNEGAIGKVGELGLGYGMGANKFMMTCKTGPMGMPPMLWVDEELSNRTVSTWRTVNSEIVNGWAQADGILPLMADPTMKPFRWKTVDVFYQGLRLPNGLFMQYPRLKYDVSPFGDGRTGWQYWDGKMWKMLWGGVIIENIIQGISRCVLTQAARRIKQRFADEQIDGILVLNVHDELIFKVEETRVEQASTIVREEMTRRPDWCDETLVLDATVEVAYAYTK